MSFEKAFVSYVGSADFGKAPLSLRAKARTHISRMQMDRYGEARYVDMGLAVAQERGDAGARYIGIIGMTYDFALIMFEVNSRAAFVARSEGISLKEGAEKAAAWMGRFKNRGKFEARVIGMQTGHPSEDVKGTGMMLRDMGAALMEADLFGDEARHIAMDCETGAIYNILMNDKPYAKGELATKIGFNEFMDSVRRKPAPLNIITK